MNFKFQKVTETALAATKTAWQEQHASDPEAGSWMSYLVWLDWFEKDISGPGIERGTAQGGIYGVFEDHDPNVACALVNIGLTNSTRRDVRVMDVQFSPSLDTGSADSSRNLVRLSWIACHVVIGAIGLSYEGRGAERVKIQAQVPLTREFLSALAAAITASAGELFSVTNEGKFIVISKITA